MDEHTCFFLIFFYLPFIFGLQTNHEYHFYRPLSPQGRETVGEKGLRLDASDGSKVRSGDPNHYPYVYWRDEAGKEKHAWTGTAGGQGCTCIYSVGLDSFLQQPGAANAEQMCWPGLISDDQSTVCTYGIFSDME